MTIVAFAGSVAATILSGCASRPPGPDSWWTWSINLAVAVGTVGAVVVALFLEPLRTWLFPPTLRLRLNEGFGLGIDREAPQGRKHSTPVWWFCLKVSSGRRRLPVHGVRVILTKIRDDEGHTTYGGEIAMTWGLTKEATRTIGPEAVVDLCALYEDRVTPEGERLGLVLELQPARPIPHTLPKQVLPGKPVILSFQARGDEVDSHTLDVRIAWDGKWGATEKEIKEHLSVGVP